MPLAAAAERAIATRKIALKTGRPVIDVRTWRDINGAYYVNTVEELVKEPMPYF